MSEWQIPSTGTRTQAAGRVDDVRDFPQSVCPAGGGLATGVGLFDDPRSLGQMCLQYELKGNFLCRQWTGLF